MKTLSHNPEHWRRIVKRLESKSSRLEAAEVQALTEACFRLAVHPTTPLAEAIKLLRKCLHWDSANPRFAYHLSRAFYVNGQLEEAARWLEIAGRLSPTSHRIWAHACLLNWDLNTRFQDKKYVTDSLRDRGRAIAKVIQEGQEPHDLTLISFKPEELRTNDSSKISSTKPDEESSKEENGKEKGKAERNGRSQFVRRVLNPGMLRWSGIKDLVVENNLSGERGSTVIKELMPMLTTVARKAKQKRGGLASFAILAIEWIISGYPLATIRRLITELELDTEAGNSPSIRLLNHICQIYEATSEEALELLSAGVREGQIPPLLASVIHRRRILWRPLVISGISQYRTARQFFARVRRQKQVVDEKQRDQRASELNKRLEQVLRDLDPPPPEQLADWIPVEEESDVAMGVEQILRELDQLTVAAEQLANIRKNLAQFLKEGILPRLQQEDPTTLQQALADYNALSSAWKTITTKCAEGQTRLQMIKDSLIHVDRDALPDDIAERGQECYRSLEDTAKPGTLARQISKADRLASAVGSNDSPETVSEVMQQMSEEVHAVRIPCDDSLDTELLLLEETAKAFEEAKRQASGFLRGAILTAATDDNPEIRHQAAVDYALLKDILQLLTGAEEHGKEKTTILKDKCEKIGQDKAPANFSDRIAEFKATMDVIGTQGPLRRSMTRVESSLTASPIPEDLPACEPSPELQQIHDTLLELIAQLGLTPEEASPPGEDEALSSTPDPAAKEKDKIDRAPMEQFSLTLNKVDLAIRELFDAAEASFQGYPSELLEESPLGELLRAIKGQRAETLFRLGHRMEARRIWISILREDPYHIAARKNIAVAATGSVDTADALFSWKYYAIQLYDNALLADDLRTLSDDRMSLHRAFGDSYAPRFLMEPLTNDWQESINPEEALSFLGNSSRLKSFIDHKLLEFLTHHLRYRSPSLVLGVTQNTSRDERRSAANGIAKFGREACKPLPEQARNGLNQLIAKRLRGIDKELNEDKPQSRTRSPKDPHYKDEHKEHLRLVVDAAHMKYKLYLMTVLQREFVTRMASADFLEQFLRLDLLPLTVSEEFGTAAAASLGMTMDELQNLMQSVPRALCGTLLQFLFNPPENDKERKQQDTQYRRLTEEWMQLKAFEELLPMLDHSNRFYPEIFNSYIERIETEGVVPEMVKLLREYHSRFPRFAGVARDLAQLLIEEGKSDEALKVLDEAASLACSEDGRKLCQHSALQMKIKNAYDQENYKEAITCTETLLEEDNQNETLVMNLIVFYSNQCATSGADPGFDRLRTVVKEWKERARKFIAEWKPSEMQPDCPLDEGTFERIDQNLKEGINQGYLKLANRACNQGVSALQKHDDAEMEKYFKRARKLAQRIIDQTVDAEEDPTATEARKLLETIDDLEKQYKERSL